MEFYPVYWAFNISWYEKPSRRISSYAQPRGQLTAPGMPNNEGSHEAERSRIEAAFVGGR